ncbi:MAG: HAD-IIIA family hydrolase [Planctomycetota bacterium]|nr:MAG: HAD-IIIA family hydrolase [Planctomycetota bacterium]
MRGDLVEDSQSEVDIAQRIRCILSDVDGVLTDGRLIMDANGVESKAFYVRDGLAIKLWQRAGFAFGLLTSRTSSIVVRRADELGIAHVRQGAKVKLPVAREVMQAMGVIPEQVCYIGDDLPDIPVMKAVGLGVAVADAADEARQVARWVTQAGGGRGAVRETVRRLMRLKGCWEPMFANDTE